MKLPGTTASLQRFLCGAGLEGDLLGLDQIGIALNGLIAVWLRKSRVKAQRWACIFGILGQPFWFYAAWSAEQWGISALRALYTYAWARGLWTHWLSPYFQTREDHGREMRVG